MCVCVLHNCTLLRNETEEFCWGVYLISVYCKHAAEWFWLRAGRPPAVVCSLLARRQQMDLNMTSDLSDHVKVWLQTPRRLLALKPEQRQDRPGPGHKPATVQGPILVQGPVPGQRLVPRQGPALLQQPVPGARPGLRPAPVQGPAPGQRLGQ